MLHNKFLLIGRSHVWLFEGAEGGQWLQKYEESAERDIALGADAADRDNKRPRLQ